ncbi:MAG: endolytic transglycosylase MltG [Dethiobacter sp.]|jgi:UPF0755 protein|nr:endolytic transglycosylase MltG [Dethiobacter sp.]
MMMRTPLRILGGVALLLAVAFGLLALQINTLLQPVDIPAAAHGEVFVTIEPGSPTSGIAAALQEAGLIRSSTVFRYWAKYRAMDHKFKAGNYLLSYGMTIEEIMKKLVAGDVFRNTVMVTVPEGLTLEQIAERLAASGLVDYEEFFELASTAAPALGQVLPGQRYAMEGYLFPDTYEFEEGATAQTILNRLQSQLATVLDDRLRARAAELDLSIHQVLTLASLIEREVQVDSERQLVSAVLHNRLRRKMLLQIDATVIYALGEHKTVVLYKDLEVDSPYNTYKVAGMPPGPIAAAGRRSIEAALFPADVDYLYYRAKEDGSGGHYFAKTLAEHNANYSKVQTNRSKR